MDSSTYPGHAQGDELLRHAAWIRRLARGLVRHAASAEDLVQDAWVAALKGPAPGGRALRPWLGTVVRNAARQGFRARGRRAQREAEARGPEPLASPAELAERLETERRLTDELARLEEPYRSTLMLRYYDGLEPSEIARRLGLPAGSVRWRVKRGLELLRERLDQRFGERAHWCALVLPLAGTRELAAAGAAAGALATASAIPGVLAMNALSKVGVGVAAVLALAVTLGVAGVLPESVWPFRREAPEALAARPYVPPPEPEMREEEAAPAARTIAPEAVHAEQPAPPVAQSLPPTLVAARVVDAAGSAFAGARLRALDTGVSARSAPDGQVQLELSAAGEAYHATFELSARGYASLGVEAVVTPHERVHVGTLALHPGGAVSGRVIDSEGQPLAGALIRAGEAEVPRRVLEARRLSPESPGVPSATTRPDGSFTLEGLAAGYVRIWASAAGYLGSYSAPVEVHAGEERYGLELTLERIPPTNSIIVLVVDPSGAPVPLAPLEFRHQSRTTGTTVAGQREADAAGRHVFVVPDDALLWITAEDPGRRLGPASADAVRTGTQPLVLRLSAAAQFALKVRGASGDPVECFGFALLSPDESFEYESRARAPRPEGALSLRLPAGDFLVRVDAPGYELAQVGPFAPLALGGEDAAVEVALAPVPGIRGRVFAGGGPVAGARVRLHELVDPGVVYEKNGFLSAWKDETTDEVESDEEGRFVLTVRKAGEYAARAEKDGLAPAVGDAIAVGPGLAAADVELHLTEGGAIEGRVVTARGADPAGTIVGLSRGDGYDRTLRVGPDGTFRFERLTPGPWRLLALAEEILPGRTSITTSNGRGDQAADLDWTCTVYAGETCSFDLVLGDAEACVLRGRLAIDGAPPGRWQAWLVPEGTFFAQDPPHRTALDADGRFRLAVAEPGGYQLVLTSSLDGLAEQFLLDVVHLANGEQSWEFGLATGTLVVANVPAWDGQGIPAAVHLWSGKGRIEAITVLAGNTSGEARLAVPAGNGRIAAPDPAALDFERWPSRLAVEVPKGGEVTVSLP